MQNKNKREALLLNFFGMVKYELERTNTYELMFKRVDRIVGILEKDLEKIKDNNPPVEIKEMSATDDNHVYGLGTDGKVYKWKMDGSGEWALMMY